jgi:hypothetical protein
VDQRRLYEVGAAGAAWTRREDPAEQARRHARLRWLAGIGVAVNGVSWTLAGLALALGGRDWGAGFGLLALLTAPLLALPLAIEGLSWLRARRRHATRPEDFPGA